MAGLLWGPLGFDPSPCSWAKLEFGRGLFTSAVKGARFSVEPWPYDHLLSKDFHHLRLPPSDPKRKQFREVANRVDYDDTVQ